MLSKLFENMRQDSLSFKLKPTIINFFVTHCTKWTYHKPFISVVNSKTVHSERETFCIMFSDWPKGIYED